MANTKNEATTFTTPEAEYVFKEAMRKAFSSSPAMVTRTDIRDIFLAADIDVIIEKAYGAKNV